MGSFWSGSQKPQSSSQPTPSGNEAQIRNPNVNSGAQQKQRASVPPNIADNHGQKDDRKRPHSYNAMGQKEQEQIEIELVTAFSELEHKLKEVLNHPHIEAGNSRLLHETHHLEHILLQKLGERQRTLDNKQKKLADELSQRYQQTQDDLANEQKNRKRLLNRLSELAGARLKDNNPAIADLSDQNRPSKMSERYSELYDNEWTDVMEAVKTKTEKENKRTKDRTNEEDQEVQVIHFLRDSLIEAYSFCSRLTGTQWNRLLDLSCCPTIAIVQTLPSTEKQQVLPTIPVEARQRTHDFQKITALHVTDHLLKLFHSTRLQEVRKTDHSKSFENFFAHESYTQYNKTCLDLCWLMRVQDPPVQMVWQVSDIETDSKLFRSYTRTGSKIDFIVWPALLLHENGPILYRGVAQYSKDEKKKENSSPRSKENSSPAVSANWEESGRVQDSVRCSNNPSSGVSGTPTIVHTVGFVDKPNESTNQRHPSQGAGKSKDVSDRDPEQIKKEEKATVHKAPTESENTQSKTGSKTTTRSAQKDGLEKPAHSNQGNQQEKQGKHKTLLKVTKL